MKNYFSGSLNGVKVWGKVTDPYRPTCGNIMNDGDLWYKLVVDTDLESGFDFHECGIEAMRAAK